MATVAALETAEEGKGETNASTNLKKDPSVPDWRDKTDCENQEYFRRLGGKKEPQQKQPTGGHAQSPLTGGPAQSPLTGDS